MAACSDTSVRATRSLARCGLGEPADARTGHSVRLRSVVLRARASRRRAVARELIASDPTDQRPIGQYVSVLVHTWPVGMTDDVRVLLGELPGELPNGRVPIYVGAVCGDVGCGAVTALVERTDDVIVWRDFGRDVNYETDVDDDELI